MAGHKGLVGSAIVRILRSAGFERLILRSHAELDLTDQTAVSRFFESEKPEFVILAAAKVGGIFANDSYPAEFIHQNLAIQTNVIHESWRHGVKRFLFLGSSCIYPRNCPQPIKEEYFLTGPLEKTNQAYAVAKIAGIEMCASYNRQYGTRFLCAMPTNLFGVGDNYDLDKSHVLPALIRKAHEAKENRLSEIVVWGSGTPRRDLLLSDDLATACLRLLEAEWNEACDAFPSSQLPLLNIGTGQDVTINDLTRLVCEVIGFSGSITRDTSKPDGTPRKLLDVSRMSSLGWRPTTSLRKGIEIAYADFLSNHRNTRSVTQLQRGRV